MVGLSRAGVTLRAALSGSAMRRVLLGYLVFATTEWAAWVAILLFAYENGGASTVALVAVVQLVPGIFIAPLGSTLSERMSRQTAVSMAYSVLALSMLALFVTAALDADTWVFYMFAAVSNCAVTLCRPAHFAAIPRLADTAEELVAANSASTTLEYLGVFLGPAMLTVLIPVFGLSSVFLICTAMEVVAVALIVTIKAGPATQAAIELKAQLTARSSSFITEALGGWREVRATEGAAALLGLIGVQFAIVGMLDVLGVVFPQQELGTAESGASVIIAASGIGGFIGAAVTVMLVGRQRLAPAFVAGFVGAGLFLAFVSATGVVATAALLVGMSGFARAFIDVAGRTLLQRTISQDALARVFGLQESVLMLGLAVGAVLAPVAIAVTSPRGAFIVAGAVPALLAVAAWPWLRSLDAAAVLPGPEFTILQGILLFAPLAQARLELLSRRATSRDVATGETIFAQGDVGDNFYVVQSGQVSVRRDGIEVDRTTTGGFFGEVALLRDAPRNASIVALAPTRLLAVDRATFLSAVTGSPASHDEAERVIQRRQPPTPSKTHKQGEHGP